MTRQQFIVRHSALALNQPGACNSAICRNDIFPEGQAVIERLRWRKIKRVPADIADSIREALHRHNEESLSRAKHEVFIARQEAGFLAARLSEIDPDFYGPDIDRLRRSSVGNGSDADLSSGG